MQLTPADFSEIQQVVHDLCGLVIPEDKQYLVTSRLEPVLQMNGLASFAALVLRLKQPDTLLLKDQIIEAITTNETSFNRDTHPFEGLRRFVLPELANRLIERRKSALFAYQRARIWCAAAATGQEAYSVGMAVADFLAARSDRDQFIDRFSILSSDISSKSLATAREGRYSSYELDRGVTADQRARYFQQQDGMWVIDSSVRRMVEFRPLNLIQELPDLGAFDLILCRNLLIYFDEATRRRVCRQLHAALVPQGILMIGAAESLYGVTDAFSLEHLGNTVVYRKR